MCEVKTVASVVVVEEVKRSLVLPVYKTQHELRKEIHSLMARKEQVVVDTNVESFQVLEENQVLALDRSLKSCTHAEFGALLHSQRIDRIFIGRRAVQEEDDEGELKLVYEYVARDCDEIIERLHLGSADAAKRATEYDCVFNCTGNLKSWGDPGPDKYVQTHWNDVPDQKLDGLSEYTEKLHRVLSSGKRALVHCEQGKSAPPPWLSPTSCDIVWPISP